MLEAQTQFEIEPALTVLKRCKLAQYPLIIEQCLYLYMTAQQYYFQTEQEAAVLNKLIEVYTHSHKSFMDQTQQLLETLIAGGLMESSFDIGLMSKLKAAEKFYLKALTKVTQNSDKDLNYEHYFHIMATSLTYCVDVHLDALRVSEAAIHAYQRQEAGNEIRISNELVVRIEYACEFIAKSRAAIQQLRQILVEANLHMGQTGFLPTVMNALKNFAFIPQEAQAICSQNA